MGDRGGGRESKNWTLRKSKKNPGCSAGKNKTVAAGEKDAGPVVSAPVPAPRSGTHIDAGVALLSRQFDRDRGRVLARAQADGVAAMVAWCPDIEKVDELVALAQENPGLVYFVAGTHPDNVSKTSKHKHDDWMARVEVAGRHAECVGILTGLNLTRDVATHFAQTSLLTAACQAADRLELPLVLHVAPDGESLDRVMEILRVHGWAGKDSDEADPDAVPMKHRRLILHNAVAAAGGDPQRLRAACKDAELFCAVPAEAWGEGAAGPSPVATEVLRSIPLRRLLAASDAPWRTPQNHPDAHVRSSRNEPANLAFVAHAWVAERDDGLAFDALAHALKTNAVRAYGLNAAERSTAADAGDSLAAACAADGVPLAEDGVPLVLAPASTAVLAPPIVSAPRVDGDSAPRASEPGGGYYSCLRCRAELFPRSAVAVHALAAPFDAGVAAAAAAVAVGAGLCTPHVFVPNVDGLASLRVRSGNVECVECDQKLGRFSSAQSQCACGALVPGPVAKLATAKLDFFDGGSDVEVLVARALDEADDAKQEAADDEALRLLGKAQRKEKDSKKKKQMAKNRGNFSEYRNKTFSAPVGSRSQLKAAAAAAAAVASATAEDDEEDDDEDSSDDL